MKIRVKYLVEIEVPPDWELVRAEGSDGFCVLAKGEMLAQYNVVAWLSDRSDPLIREFGGWVYPHDSADELEAAITTERVDEFHVIEE